MSDDTSMKSWTLAMLRARIREMEADAALSAATIVELETQVERANTSAKRANTKLRHLTVKR